MAYTGQGSPRPLTSSVAAQDVRAGLLDGSSAATAFAGGMNAQNGASGFDGLKCDGTSVCNE